MEKFCISCKEWCEPPSTTRCGHLLCQECLEGLLASPTPVCPTCNASLPRGVAKLSAARGGAATAAAAVAAQVARAPAAAAPATPAAPAPAAEFHAEAVLSEPTGIARSPDGATLYIVDAAGALLLKVGPEGDVRALAGGGPRARFFPQAVDALGASAVFVHPTALAVDSAGRIYVSDTGAHTLRRVDPGTGQVETLAGVSGVAGYACGAGAMCKLSSPRGLALGRAADGSEVLYIADEGNHCIRALPLTPAAHVSLLAGSGSSTPGFHNSTLLLARFSAPTALAVDAAGGVLVADSGNCLIRRIHGGVVSTHAGVPRASSWGAAEWRAGPAEQARFAAPQGLAVLPDGRTLVAFGGRMATIAASFPHDVAFSPALPGRLVAACPAALPSAALVADAGSGCVMTLDLQDLGAPMKPCVGQGPGGPCREGLASAARLAAPYAILTLPAAAQGSVFLDAGGRLRTLSPQGMVATCAYMGMPQQLLPLAPPTSLALSPCGSRLFFAAAEAIFSLPAAGGQVEHVAGAAGHAGFEDGTLASPRMWGPCGLAFGKGPLGRSSLYFCDAHNHAVRVLDTATGAVRTLAGGVRCQLPAPLQALGRWLAQGPLGSLLPAALPAALGYACGHEDGAAGQGSMFHRPCALAVAASGLVYVADAGNGAIRVVSPDGSVRTVSRGGSRGGKPRSPCSLRACAPLDCFRAPCALVLSQDDSCLYVADEAAHTISCIELLPVGSRDGARVRVVGGVAGQAGRQDGVGAASRFNAPCALALRGNSLLVADRGNHALRIIDLGAGRVETLAGAAGVRGGQDGRGASQHLYQSLVRSGAW